MGTDLADMQLIAVFNKEIRFLLCVIDLFSEYLWIVLLKDEKGITIVSAFQKVWNKSIWRKIHNEEKSVTAEEFIRTLKNKIYKHVTSM